MTTALCPIVSADGWMQCSLPNGHAGPHDMLSIHVGDKRCTVYDRRSDRTCRYYAGHGGRHNFASISHDSALERALRRELDQMIATRDEACNELEDTGGEFAIARAAELRKVGA